jgi:hypothetical protein
VPPREWPASLASYQLGPVTVLDVVLEPSGAKTSCYQRQCGAVGVDSSTWCNWCDCGCVGCTSACHRAALPPPPLAAAASAPLAASCNRAATNRQQPRSTCAGNTSCSALSTKPLSVSRCRMHGLDKTFATALLDFRSERNLASPGLRQAGEILPLPFLRYRFCELKYRGAVGRRQVHCTLIVKIIRFYC